MDVSCFYFHFADLSAYDVLRTSDSVMMKVFAFATSFINLLSTGLHTFSMSRYRQLNKRLGRMIRCVAHKAILVLIFIALLFTF